MAALGLAVVVDDDKVGVRFGMASFAERSNALGASVADMPSYDG